MFIFNEFSKEMGAFDHHPITLSPTTGMDVNRSKHKSFKTEKNLSFQDIDFNHLMTHDESLAIIKVKRHHQLCH